MPLFLRYVGREGKKASRMIVFVSTLFMTVGAIANPELNNVASGNATVSTQGSVETINQTSQKAILNWNSFNIASQEATHFNQPTGGVALNRISPLQGASQIFGTLTATGRIILINPAGVYFGPSSRVNVGSIIVSTSGMSDSNFLADKYIFDQPSPYHAAVINQGTINTADYGLAALMGTGVVNNGTIQANMGTVALGSGEKFTMDFNGDKLINFSVDAAATTAGVDQNGQPLKNGVNNTGNLIADGGTVLVNAKTAEHVIDNVVNISGVAQARSVSQTQNGEIILSGEGAPVRVSGKLIASNHHRGHGGKIKVLAKQHHVYMDSTAEINVSGDSGGGTILIGGNAQGMGLEPHASDVTIAQGAILNASALDNGNGGNIVVWSDNNTQFHGSILATGGINGGNGGTVETSGHILDVNGSTVNLRAPQGVVGTWLLDPADLTICAACTTTASLGGTIYSSGSNSNLLVTDLISALSSANVTVQTTSSGSGGLGDILLTTPISNWGSNMLTLSAYHDINLQGNNISNNGTGNLVLRTDNTGTGVGTLLSGGANVNLSGGGSVSIYYNPTVFGTQDVLYTGGTTPTEYMLVNNVTNLQNMNGNLAGNYALGKDIDASGMSFTPIGSTGTPYTGLFDGQGYLIKNITINGASDVGLFGALSGGSIANVGISGSVTGLTNVGSLVGSLNAGSITDSYSFASVTGGTNVGGLVGNNNGTIATSYSIGDVTGGLFTGGLVGRNTGTVINSYWDTSSSGQASSAGGTGETTTQLQAGLPSGFSSSVWGSIAGVSYPYLLASHPTTPRVVSGQVATLSTLPSATNNTVLIPQWPPVADNLGNATVTLAANGTILDNTQTGANGSYYFLEPNGVLADSTPLLTYLSNGGNATSITLAPTAGGSIKNLYLALNTVLLANNADPNNATVGYNVDISTPNPTAGYLVNFVAAPVTSITNDNMATALGSLSDSNILYTTSGSDININSTYNFVTAPNTLYGLTGNLSTTNGNITFLGPVIEGIVAPSYNQNVTVQTNISGNIVNNNTITYTEGTAIDPATGNVIPNSDTLFLNSADNIVINAPILGMWWTGTGNPGGGFNPALLGSVTLSSAYHDRMTDPFPNDPFNPANTPASITLGPSGAVSVYNFNLDQGNWWQVVPHFTTYGSDTVNTLPYYAVNYPAGSPAIFTQPLYGFLSLNNFSIANGHLPSTQAEFIRAAYESTPNNLGTLGNPYLIEGLYGLQGIASDAYTLSRAYRQVQLIGGSDDGISTFFWNDGAGFVPIGDGPGGARGQAQIGFSGSFDGAYHDDVSLNINWPDTNYVGLFGYTTTSSHISNIGNLSVTLSAGDQYVGDLVGYNNGQIENIYLPANASIVGNDIVGGLVGYNSSSGSINNSAVLASSVTGNNNGLIGDSSNVGGIAGVNAGTINHVLSVPILYSGSTLVTDSNSTSFPYFGAIAGSNSGTIQNSFWDVNYSGLSNAVGTNLGFLSNVQGGCFGGLCPSGLDLTQESTYAGWTFSSSAWGIVPGVSYPVSYPYLPIAEMTNVSLISNAATIPLSYTSNFFITAPTGTTPQFVSGFLTGLDPSFLVNQPVAAIASNVFASQPPFNAFLPAISGFVGILGVSGANGFFYGSSTPGFLPTDVVTILPLGNLNGSATVLYSALASGSIQLTLPVTLASGGSGSSIAAAFNAAFFGAGTQYGFINSLLANSNTIQTAVIEINAYTNLYLYNLLNGGSLQQNNLLAACNDISSKSCQELLAEYGGATDTPTGAILKMLSDEVKKDEKIKKNNEFTSAKCL